MKNTTRISLTFYFDWNAMRILAQNRQLHIHVNITPKLSEIWTFIVIHYASSAVPAVSVAPAISFSWRRPFEIFFSGEAFRNLFFPGGGFDFFSLYRPIKKLPKIVFFSHKNFSGFIFSWGGPFEIYFFLGKAFWYLFFLGKAFWDLFFPGEGPARFFFSISPASPQIINGRPLWSLFAPNLGVIAFCCIWQDEILISTIPNKTY